jgi:oligopeptide transport system substrate-binding protein
MIRRLSALALVSLALASCRKETEVGRANREGILLVGNSAEPKALDPHLVSGVIESKIIGALFEGLVADDPLDDDALPPGAAASWEHNEDLTAWTFRLRPDGKWSDGRTVTASDFIFAYRRLLSPDLAGPYAEMLYPLDHAEAFNKDRRGEILFKISPPDGGPAWEAVKEVPFGGVAFETAEDGTEDPEAKAYEEVKELAWDDLDEAQRKIFVLGKGLDHLGRGPLEWIAEAPADRFRWPDGFTDAAAVLARLIEHAGKDLWDLAKVGVRAPDSDTLELRLREPVPYLPSLTRHYTWFPVPEHVVRRFGRISDRYTPWSEIGNLVGNGPFQLEEWRFHDVIEVGPNPHYWDAENVGLKGIRFHPIENPYTEARAFLAGQLHTTYTLPSDLIDTMEREYPQFLRQEPYVGTTFIRLNTTRPGLDNPKVRQALSLAIDRDLLCEHILEGYTPALTLTPKMGGYEPEPVLAFDPEKARALLAEAGYPKGAGFPRYSLLISRPSARASAEAFQAMWKDHLDINIDIQNKDWGSYISAQQNLDFDMASAGWIGDYLDPTTFLTMWTKGNGNNNTGWHSKRFESMLKDAAQKADPAERFRLLAEAEKLLMEERPILPVSWYSRNYLHRPEVKGWHPLLLDNHPWKAVRLEP